MILLVVCLLEAVAIAFMATSRVSQASPPTDGEQWREALAVLRRMERRLGELPRADPATISPASGRSPADAPQPSSTEELLTLVGQLREITSAFGELARTLSNNEGAWLAPVGELSSSYPEPNVANLSSLARELDAPEGSNASRQWFFRPARDVIMTFGRPTSYNKGGYWWYEFTTPDDLGASVGFQVVSGVVVGCSGSIHDRTGGRK